MEVNVTQLMKDIHSTVANHLIGSGQYARTRTADGVLGPVNAYGCADAVNLLYTINRMPTEPAERAAMADAICLFQDPVTGLFNEGSHVVEHGTAHCLAALELLDARPKYEVVGFDKYNTPESMSEFLEGLNFIELKGSGHYGAGVFCSLFLSRRITPEVKRVFFDRLNAYVDKKYGMGKEGGIDAGFAPMWHHMGDWFHFLFCYHGAREPFPNKERLIDSCIMLYEKNMLSEHFGRGQRFLEIDWAFSLYRAVIQCGYRYDESMAILRKFAYDYANALIAVDKNADRQWNDLHLLFGAVCALAELQFAVPDVIRSDYPLRQVLDRRPFI